jgi:hypothetical protein
MEEHLLELKWESHKCRNLWKHVIARAIRDAMQYRKLQKQKAERTTIYNEYRGGYIWIMHHDTGFADVCQALDLSPKAIRKFITTRSIKEVNNIFRGKNFGDTHKKECAPND